MIQHPRVTRNLGTPAQASAFRRLVNAALRLPPVGRWSLLVALACLPLPPDAAAQGYGGPPSNPNPAPNYGAPNYGAPNYGAPGAPNYGVPAYGAPAPNPARSTPTETRYGNAPYQPNPPAGRPPYAAPGTANAPGPPTSPARGPAQPELFEPAKIIARVGDQPILAGDVLGMVDQALAPHRDKMTEEQYDQQREALMQKLLDQVIDTKLLYLEYLRKIPQDRLDEALPDIWKKVYAEFDEKELPKAVERAKAESAAELDARLREFGWSLEKQRRSWGERQLGRFAVAQNVERDPEVTYDEMLAYYQEHLDDFRTEAKARWEQLTVHFDKHPSKQQAYAEICDMGNDVYLRGVPFAIVAKRRSNGIRADEGGVHDWISKGSLRSNALDEAIFTFAPNRLSPVIEDDRGFHIIRVLERTEAEVTPFRDAQVEIREELKKEKMQAGLSEFLSEVRARTPVWTIFDDEPASRSASRP